MHDYRHRKRVHVLRLDPAGRVTARGRLPTPTGSTLDPRLTVVGPGVLNYEASIAVADGQLSMQEFRANHVKVIAGKPAPAERLWDLLAAAMEHMAS